MTRITAHLPAFDDAARARRQTDLANQKDNWLRQMEMAQLNDMNKPGAKDARDDAPADAWREPAAAAAQEKATAAASTAQAAPHATRAPVNGQFAALAPGLAAPLRPGQSPALVPVFTATLARPAGIDAAHPGASQPTQRPGMVGLPAGATELASDAPLDAADAAPHAGADDEARLQQQRQFQKRMMHLTGSGQEVKLWIRDSALGQAQSMELVYRMAGDMAGMGLRLAGATINGKPALRENASAPFADSLDAEPHSPITTQEKHHGA